MRLMLLGCLVAATPMAWADSVVYYDGTGAVVGTYTSTEPVDVQKAGQQFAYGEGVSAIRLPTLPPKASTERYTVNNGQVITEVDPAAAQAQAHKQQAIARLKAKLSQQDLDDLKEALTP